MVLRKENHTGIIMVVEVLLMRTSLRGDCIFTVAICPTQLEERVSAQEKRNEKTKREQRPGQEKEEMLHLINESY